MELYARDHRVPPQEAQRRLALQEQLPAAIAALESVAPDRLAGVWLEHEPTFHLVASFTGSGRGLEGLSVAAARAPVPVEIRTGAAHSLAHLQAVNDSAADRLGADADVAGTMVDVKAGTVKILLQPTSPLRGDVTGVEARLSRETGVPIVVEVLPSRMGDDSTFGGLSFTNCTGAFSASWQGLTGILTAGHCPQSEVYDSSYSTSTMVEARDGSRDVQFNAIFVNTVAPLFYDGLNVVSVTGSMSRASQYVGMYLCHYGKTTGTSCGSLYTKNFKPTYGGACFGVPCNSTWMATNEYQFTTADGDSGGPWFTGGTALGIHKGSQLSGIYLIYMAIDYINGLGISLVQ